MRITPLDIRKQEFRRSVRGFDCDEVRAFMVTMADEYELVLVDNKQIREQLMVQEEKIAEFRTMERTLRDTLMTAEKLMQETRENATKEGELIVQDAKLKAREILQECRLRTEQLRREIEGLRKEKENYLGRFKSLAESQIQFIESHRNDFRDLDDRLTGIVDSVAEGVAASAAEAERESVVETIVEALIQPEKAPHPGVPEPAPVREPVARDAEVDIWRSYDPTRMRQHGQQPAGQEKWKGQASPAQGQQPLPQPAAANPWNPNREQDPDRNSLQDSHRKSHQDPGRNSSQDQDPNNAGPLAPASPRTQAAAPNPDPGPQDEGVNFLYEESKKSDADTETLNI